MPDVKRKRKPTDRKGGGQPGNKNALRHGFYSDLYSVKIGRELKDSLIEDEIALFRLFVRAFAKLIPTNKEPTEKQLFIFDRIVNAGIAINTFERTILLARGHGGQIGTDILTALREMNPYEDLQ